MYLILIPAVWLGIFFTSPVRRRFIVYLQVMARFIKSQWPSASKFLRHLLEFPRDAPPVFERFVLISAGQPEMWAPGMLALSPQYRADASQFTTTMPPDPRDVIYQVFVGYSKNINIGKLRMNSGHQRWLKSQRKLQYCITTYYNILQHVTTYYNIYTTTINICFKMSSLQDSWCRLPIVPVS